MAIQEVLHTGQQSIHRVLNAGLPVLLVFWRRDNSQSNELLPVLNDLAREHAGKLLVALVDAQDEAGLVAQYRLRLLPSVVIVREGKPIATLDGRVADQSLRAWAAYLTKGGPQPAVTSGPGIPVTTGKPLPTNGKSHQNAAGPATARPSASTKPVILTDATFQRTIANEPVVLVDFWAEWCGPCRMLAPTIDQLAAEFAGRALVAKLNVDENPRTAQAHNIMGIPALLIFRNGQVVDRIVGVQPLPVLRERLARVLG